MKAMRPKVPKAKSIAITSTTLIKILPMDMKPNLSWHESQAGNTALRIASITAGTKWTVDIYSTRYMCVRIGNHFTEICTSIPSLVNYFCRMLRIKVDR